MPPTLWLRGGCQPCTDHSSRVSYFFYIDRFAADAAAAAQPARCRREHLTCETCRPPPRGHSLSTCCITTSEAARHCAPSNMS